MKLVLFRSIFNFSQRKSCDHFNFDGEFDKEKPNWQYLDLKVIFR